MSSPHPINEARIALTVADLDSMLRLYRDGLGLPVINQWATPQGCGYILALGQATLELIDQAQAEYIDRTEVGSRVSGPTRLAFETSNLSRTALLLRNAGAQPVAAAVQTPWGHQNVRLAAPDGMQITLFQLPPEPSNR